MPRQPERWNAAWHGRWLHGGQARRVLAVAVWLFATGAAAAEFPKLSGRVVDAAGILKPATVAALTERLAAHERAGGNQIVVATVKSLGGEPIERYGVDLGRAWGIGQKDEDNGVLLIVAPVEREVRIEVGYGLEGDLPDAIAANIIQTKIRPRFAQGDFDAGIADGVVAIIGALGGQYVYQAERDQRRDDGLPFGFLWLVVLFLLFGMGRRRRRGLGSGLLWGAILGSTLGGGRRGSGGFGGGGFSGGGGGFGGGGASGSW